MSPTDVGSLPLSPSTEQALTPQEITALYGELRNWTFHHFDTCCMQLVECLMALIHESGKLSTNLPDETGRFVQTGISSRDPNPVLVLADLVKDSDLRQSDVDSGRLDAFRKIFDEPDQVVAKYLARIPQESIAKTNAGLTAQLSTIQAAALSYVWTDVDPHRMLFENNLVRAGAELRDYLVDKLAHLSPHDLFWKFRSAALDFVAIYERLLDAYDLMAELQKQADDAIFLARVEAMTIELRRSESPNFSWSGLRNGLSGYRSFNEREFDVLFRLTENNDSFEDFWSSPFLAATSALLDRASPTWGGITKILPESAEVLGTLLAQYDPGPVKWKEQARRILAENVFPDEPHPQSVLALQSITANIDFDSEEDVNLLERALRRGIADPGRCGWLGVCALRTARQKTNWPARRSYKLNDDPELSALFNLGNKLYEKLRRLDHHLGAIEIRMALLWELVYDPSLPTVDDNPFQLDKKIGKAVEWLKDAREQIPALLSGQMRFVGAVDLEQLSSSLNKVVRREYFSSVLMEWGTKWFEAGSAPPRFPLVFEFLGNLESVTPRLGSKLQLAYLAKRHYVEFFLPGSFPGPGSRTEELEEILFEGTPPSDVYVTGGELSLLHLASLPLNFVRAQLHLWRLWPELVKIGNQESDAGEVNKERAAEVFGVLEELLRPEGGLENDSAKSGPRSQLLEILLGDPVPELIKLGGKWLRADRWRRWNWFRRLTGLETCRVAIAADGDRLLHFREFQTFRIPEDLRYGDDGAWLTFSAHAKPFGLSEPRDNLVRNNSFWVTVVGSQNWMTRLDAFGQRIFQQGQHSLADAPFFVVSDMEVSLALIACALLQAVSRGRHDLEAVAAWLRGTGKLACLPAEPTEESGTPKLRAVEIGEFLFELGLQDEHGVPTERLHSLVDFPFVEVFCRRRGGLPIDTEIIPNVTLDDWKLAATIPRNLWYREFSLKTGGEYSECGRAAVEALWELISPLLTQEFTAEMMLQELDRALPIVDTTEEFWYRRHRQMPIAFVALPLVLRKADRQTSLPQAFAVLRVSGIFLTREYRRRAVGDEFGDWFRFGDTASATYRLAAERLVAMRRFLTALGPFFDEPAPVISADSDSANIP